MFDDDLIKGTLSNDYLQSLACYFTSIESRIEANHKTKFVLMIAPDRTTAYQAYLPGLHLPDLTERLAQTAGLTMVRLDQVMQGAIAAGTKDVYYPSDTHWASTGMALAAEAFIRSVAPGRETVSEPVSQWAFAAVWRRVPQVLLRCLASRLWGSVDVPTFPSYEPVSLPHRWRLVLG